MKTCISSSSMKGELADKLSAAAAAGFRAVEIAEQDLLSHGGMPADLGRLICDHDLQLATLVTSIQPEGLNEPHRGRAFDLIRRRLDMMQDLGTDLLVIASTTRAESVGGVDRIAADLAELGGFAAARGVRIGYEARAWGRHVADYRDAWEIVRRADKPAVGLVLDSFHILARGLSPENIRSIPGDRIFHVQLADAPAIDMDLSFKSHHFRCLPKEGALPLAAFLRAVAATDYDGVCSIETANTHSRGSARTQARDAHRALLHVTDSAGRSEPSDWLGNGDLPPRAKVVGVEFVEFTASADDAGRLGAMLHQLGFAPTARHVSKDVSLWRQAGINIVINSEQRGYAHSAYVMHGMSVCDIGLMVDDARTTTLRAKAFGANDFSQNRGTGELAIPAVRGVGGSVLHFLDRASELSRVWETEFRPVSPGLQPHPASLLRIDHVAQVMGQDELLTWTLLYSAIFDMEKAPDVDVADPGGIVQSRALQNAEGTVRFTLNGVDTHHTFAGRFLSDSYGSSVQHIAFATDDLFATAARLALNGFECLPIPTDYYADLAAEFALDPTFVRRLAAANALYDEDGEGGSYLQIYSRPFGDGFFFEIVERRGGYSGYGARNAPYRTAAQLRVEMATGTRPEPL